MSDWFTYLDWFMFFQNVTVIWLVPSALNVTLLEGNVSVKIMWLVDDVTSVLQEHLALVQMVVNVSIAVNVWLGKLTALDMTPLGWLGRKTSTQTNVSIVNALLHSAAGSTSPQIQGLQVQ